MGIAIATRAEREKHRLAGVCQYNRSKEFFARFGVTPLRLYHQLIYGSNARLTRPQIFLMRRCADATEHEGGLWLCYLAVHFEQGIGQKIDRTAGRLGIDHQIAAFRQFETICRIMTEVVIGQLWIFPSFADVHRHPASICKKFGPAVIAVDRSLIFVGGNRRADRKAGGYAYAARQSDEVGMEITAVPGSRVA